ncbi:MAG TPA: DUF3108 domain-containing protein [Candidatus Acidoferrales bacterium]|nr:DUF3108 domain-containing protein [Candidatus Acidoferrales bacterium]
MWAAAAALVVFAFAAGASGLGGWNQGRGKTPPAAPPAPVAVPFAPGERLEYAASWNGTVTAATFKLAVVERRDFFGRMAWHFQAQAKTIDPVRMIFTLDDQFDSYTDAITLESRQYEAYIREQSKHDDLVVPMSVKPDASRGNAHVYLVLAGTQDPLGLMYRLRAQDWKKEPTLRLPVFDGKKFYEVEATRESSGAALAVAGGNFVVTRVALKVSQGGQEVANLKVRISFSEDAARVPVLFEAEAPFGTVRAELTAK